MRSGNSAGGSGLGQVPGAGGAPPSPSPALLMDTINAYQKTAAIKAAIELDLFTCMADGPATAAQVAAHCQSPERSIRILCDYLVLQGFLTKSEDCYALTLDSSVFLSRKSPAYAGGVIEFLLSREITGSFDHLTAAMRKGGTAHTAQGTLASEHPVWLSFARSMGPMMAPAAAGLAELIAFDPAHAARVLDISASHGMWGLAVARRNPMARVVALDWAPVLEVARENAHGAGVIDRFSTVAGNAFDVDFGDPYDAVLVPNFLHHFSVADCVKFLRKTHGALRSGGCVVIVEFVPNPDRVTPPMAAGFSLTMLATTPEGDAYTFEEYAGMLAEAGFQPPTQHALPASMNVAVIAKK